MIVAGIDIGSRGAKGVILKDGKLLVYFIGDTGPESTRTSQMVMYELLKKSGLTLKDIQYVVATGYGRVLVPFANENISEISCHARGVNYYFPSVRTILDMGGQDCKAISVGQNGQVNNFVMNDKCAGGTGRFLEMIADVLNTPLQKIGEVSLESKNAIPFNTICAVFAKSEAINYQRKGIAKSDILSGLHEAIATRCLNLLKRVSIQKDFSISGGIAKNRGMVAKIKAKVGLEPLLSEDPQIIGALGAALFAEDRLKGVKFASGKVNFGYSDGTGEYFITIDNARCDGCGKCVPACPVALLAIADDPNGKPKAVVKEELRKKLAQVCPGSTTARLPLIAIAPASKMPSPIHGRISIASSSKMANHFHPDDLQPARFLVENSNLLPGGRAIDIAMGSGQNIIYLAQMGFEVEGVDISSDAVQNANDLAKRAGISLKADVADLEKEYRIKDSYYDVIICFHYLQRSLIPQIKAGLRHGGMVVYETFIVEQATLFGKPKNPEYLLKHNELLEMFRDFRVLRYREGVIGDYQAIASIIAQKI